MVTIGTTLQKNGGHLDFLSIEKFTYVISLQCYYLFSYSYKCQILFNLSNSYGKKNSLLCSRGGKDLTQ